MINKPNGNDIARDINILRPKDFAGENLKPESIKADAGKVRTRRLIEDFDAHKCIDKDDEDLW